MIDHGDGGTADIKIYYTGTVDGAYNPDSGEVDAQSNAIGLDPERDVKGRCGFR